ncbi:MAG: ABC transporter permease [Limisphaerales bacterium]
MLNGIKYALRVIRKYPLSNAVIVFTIGALVAVIGSWYGTFRMMDLRQMPFDEPDRMVRFWPTSKVATTDQYPFDIYKTVQENAQSFEKLGAYSDYNTYTLTEAGEPVHLRAVHCTAEVLEISDKKPVIGRFFSKVDEEPGNREIVVLAEHIWRQNFQARKDILGENVILNEKPYTVVGVAPEVLADSHLARNADLWMPTTWKIRTDHTDYVTAVGLLKSGTEIAKAQAELESLIIAMTGGTLGLAIAYGGVDLITRLMPTGLPRLNTVALDERALLFAGALCLVAMTIFGLAPAWRPLRSRLSAALKDTGKTSHGTGREWVRKFLVASQVAMAVILLTSAGLMIRSVNKLLAVDPGYNPDNLLSMSLYHLGDKNRGLETTEREAWLNTLTEKINAIPGIQQIGIQHQAGRPKLRQPNTLRDIDVAHMYTGTEQHDVLATMGVRYLAGRTFTKADHSANTVIINETMAKKFWPDTDPIGQLVRTADEKKTYEVIGVVADTRAWAYDQPILPAIYEPYSRKEMAGWSQVFVRTANEPSSVITGIRKSVHQFDASLPPVSPSITAHNLLHQTLARRTYMWFLTGFAGVGLALALIGLYGVVAYSVAQRTREFGIRMALGARVADVLKVVLTQGLKVTMMGILIGLAAANSLTNILSSQLFEVAATDPTVFILVPIVMAAVALAACLIPASKAAKTQPMEALRHE